VHNILSARLTTLFVVGRKWHRLPVQSLHLAQRRKFRLRGLSCLHQTQPLRQCVGRNQFARQQAIRKFGTTAGSIRTVAYVVLHVSKRLQKVWLRHQLLLHLLRVSLHAASLRQRFVHLPPPPRRHTVMCKSEALVITLMPTVLLVSSKHGAGLSHSQTQRATAKQSKS
jgi:hypothetical protein